MATEADIQIGANVVRLRGRRTQQSIADAMRERGWRWSQATVWSVEQGERPLRLTEARVLATVLGCRLEDLTEAPPTVQARAEAEEALRVLLERAVVLTERFRSYASDHQETFARLQEQMGSGLLEHQEAERISSALDGIAPERLLMEALRAVSGIDIAVRVQPAKQPVHAQE